jgi:thiol-disulfide isomerase/thioredoxin
MKGGAMPKKMVIFFVALAVCLLAFTGASMASGESTITGGVLASIKLPVTQDKNAKNYLGLSGEGSFAISQIKAEVVIIEIFNMYCNNCQKEAPRVNDLYQLINKNPNLKGKIKMIGIGVGNTPLEVEVFRETYQVLFPLFPDEDYSIHKACGEVRTPYFIGVTINADGSLTVFLTKEGGFQDPAQFLKQIVTASGL